MNTHLTTDALEPRTSLQPQRPSRHASSRFAKQAARLANSCAQAAVR